MITWILILFFGWLFMGWQFFIVLIVGFALMLFFAPGTHRQHRP